MSETILKIENLSKQYRLGTVGTGTISDDLKRWWYNLRGKEDPFLKIGDVNDRSTKGTSDYVWALKDINFEVKKGVVLGIIGKNGAGKSTLLKILSKITSPTTGSVKFNGRVASLLEVGTGFHGEMTGRENIFLNGAILGMTKKEITAKYDEIVEFSGCERYIDTPVKRYSSGMTVRLAFAVAAFLEPDILIIDEVLAVGDAEFQKKAIGKMQDISKGEGRTILFVSHNMAAVQSLCTRGVLLENGGIKFSGNLDECVHIYLQNKNWKGINKNVIKKGKLQLSIEKINFITPKENSSPITGQPLSIEFILKKTTTKIFKSVRLDFKIEDLERIHLQDVEERHKLQQRLDDLLTSEKSSLASLQSRGDQIVDYEKRLEQGTQRVAQLTDAINKINAELSAANEELKRSALQRDLLDGYKNRCKEKLLQEKDQVIDAIKEYVKKWVSWVEKSRVDVNEQKRKLLKEFELAKSILLYE